MPRVRGITAITMLYIWALVVHLRSLRFGHTTYPGSAALHCTALYCTAARADTSCGRYCRNHNLFWTFFFLINSQRVVTGGRRSFLWFCLRLGVFGPRGGFTHVMHGRSRTTIDPRIPAEPTVPGRSTSG